LYYIDSIRLSVVAIVVADVDFDVVVDFDVDFGVDVVVVVVVVDVVVDVVDAGASSSWRRGEATAQNADLRSNLYDGSIANRLHHPETHIHTHRP